MTSMTRARTETDAIIPPGEYLADELTAREMTQKELSERMGRPYQVINEIVRGKKAITARTALELEAVFETPAYIWMNLESEYQLAVERDRLRRTG